MVFILYFIFLVPGLIVLGEFLDFLFTGKILYFSKIKRNRFRKINFILSEFSCLIILPFIFSIMNDLGHKRNCYTGGAYFSPNHQLTIYTLILACIGFYFYARYREKIAIPIIEIVTNCFLLIGVILNVFIAIQIGGIGLVGNIPIIMLFLIALNANHKLLLDNIKQYTNDNQSTLTKLSLRILTLKPIQKIPILLALCLPTLVIIAGLLLLFGQKTDSIISAFTETYRHGFSLLEPCD